MRTLAGLLITLLIFFLTGCSNEKPVYVISSSHQLLLPFKASKFFGFFDKQEIDLQLDSVPNGDSLIRFLNFSKYTVVITDAETARRIEELSPRWLPICKVALKKKENYPITERRGGFVLLMKETLLRNQKEAVAVIKGWNNGVDLLKDPAVVKLLSAEKLKYKFLHCGE